MKGLGLWPPVVPSSVLTEALTGDPRRDFHVNRVLAACEIEPVDERLARRAAALRTAAAQDVRPPVSGKERPLPSAVDAIVVALADHLGGGTVVSDDRHDMQALAAHTVHRVNISTD